MAGQAIISGKTITIQIVRRDLLQPVPGSAEPRHEHTPFLTTRASVKSKMGVAEVAKVDINGKQVTHTFEIRYTMQRIDTRHFVRDVTGRLFQILSVENVNLQNITTRLHCASVGDESTEAAR